MCWAAVTSCAPVTPLMTQTRFAVGFTRWHSADRKLQVANRFNPQVDIQFVTDPGLIFENIRLGRARGLISGGQRMAQGALYNASRSARVTAHDHVHYGAWYFTCLWHSPELKIRAIRGRRKKKLHQQPLAVGAIFFHRPHVSGTDSRIQHA